jgi:hypothetical protein
MSGATSGVALRDERGGYSPGSGRSLPAANGYDIAVFIHGPESFGDEAWRLAEIGTDILYDTGAKTHAGVRKEFARLAKDDGRIAQTMTTFLARAYE